MKNFISIFYYGNIFYGLCTVALSIETNLQQGIPLNSVPFYILIFLATIVYYSRIYYSSSMYSSADERTAWYKEQRPAIKKIFIAALVIIALDILVIILRNYEAIYSLTSKRWMLIILIPLIGAMYTFQLLPSKKLRHIGWLKPFVIGFVWAGIVTVFPILFWHIRNPDVTFKTLQPAGLLWLQNFLFISALAMAFDIKDHDTDKLNKLYTYPAKFGIDTTIKFFILPLIFLSFCSGFIYQTKSHVPTSLILLQLVPYIISVLVIANANKRQSLLFYLIVVDGLMFLKALFGIGSVLSLH